MTTTRESVPIMTAALRLGVSREQLLRRILVGEVAGRQEGRYWFVDRASLERAIEAERATAARKERRAVAVG